MGQHHYFLNAIRMQELREEADRQRRWRLADEANGRVVADAGPGWARALIARSVAALSRGAGQVARRLDARVRLDPGTERLLRDA